MVFSVGVSAQADPWGTNTSDTGAHPDSDPHTYCLGPVDVEELSANIASAEWDALDPTEANVDYQTTCDLSSNTETDVVWTSGALSGNTRGVAYCEDFDTYCDQFYVKLDIAEINEDTNDEADQTKTACHELGHTAGLTHTAQYGDCMISGERPSLDVKWARYAPHHKDPHIADWF